jgi:sugar O-acyltransferase (sialic acid O-acetyltransferase NeuD family)
MKKQKRIVIIGAGGMAREIASALQWINRMTPSFEFLGYVVSDLSKLTDRDSQAQVLGDLNWIEKHQKSVDALAIGIGTPSVRVKLAQELQKSFNTMEYPSIVHPTAVVDYESAQLGPGCFIGAGCVSTVNLVLDAFALCNFGSTIGHETRVGRGSVVNPGANLSGGVVIEDGVLIGTGAQVLQYLRVCRGATVGAGAVVIHDVPVNTTVVGIPARPLVRRQAASGR